VKFEDERAIYQILLCTVKQALGKFNIVPSIDFETDNSIQIPVLRKDTKINMPHVSIDAGYNPFNSNANSRKHSNLQHWESLYDDFENENRKPDIFSMEDDPLPAVAASTHFQLKGKYILTSVKSGLMLIDQKRAHERILFEQYLVQMQNRSSASQQSLFPETVELSPDEMSLWLELKDDFAALGFDIRILDELTVNVYGSPGDTNNKNPAVMFRSLLDDFRHMETDLLKNRSERLAAAMAQESAIRYNQSLSGEEMAHIAEKLFACEMPNYSPTGKPVIHILKMEDIDNFF